MWVLKGGDFLFFFFFFWFLFCWRWGDSFDFVGLRAIGGIVDILNDGWDSWGEWEGRVGEWESGRGSGRVGLWWGGGEGKGRMMRMGSDEDGMVYVYMIVQMSINIRDSQTRRVKDFLWRKKVIM